MCLPNGTGGRQRNTSDMMHSTKGKDARSEKEGRLSLSRTLSISSCARSCVDGFKTIAMKNTDREATVWQ